MPSKLELNVLSEREEQVLLLSTKGLTDKEIAKKLGLSIATVNTYWVRIRTKLGGANRAELVASALNRNTEETLTARELENQRLIGEIIRRAEAEKALRESQERLQAIIDGSPVVIFLKDNLGRYMMVNKQFEQLIGKDRRELIGKRDSEVLPQSQAEQARQSDSKVLNNGETVTINDVWARKGEPTRHFITIKFPLYNVEGAPYAVCGFSNDVTDSLVADQTLKESEERFRALIENTADMVTLIDRKGTILYSSPSTTRTLGFTPEELLGKNAFTFIHREDLHPIIRDFNNLVESAECVVNAEYRVRHKDGSYRWVEGVGRNLLDESAVEAVVLTYRDVTARHEHQEERERLHHQVQESEHRFRGIADQSPVFIWMADPTGSHHFFNKSWTDFTGKKMKDLAGEGWKELVHPSDASTVQEQYTSSFANHKPFEIEFRVKTKRDSYRWIYCQGTPMFGPDKSFEGFIGSCIDIEDRKRVEQDLKAANEALERRARIRTIELEEANARLGEEVSERKRAEEDLLDAHQLTQMIIQSSNDGIMAFDKTCRLTVWNTRMEKLIGVTRADAVGKPAFDVLPFLTKTGDDEYFLRALKGESAVRPAQEIKVPGSKKPVCVEAHYSPLRNDHGDIVGGLSIWREAC